MIDGFEVTHARNLRAKSVADKLGMTLYTFQQVAVDALLDCIEECGTGQEHEEAHGLCHCPPLLEEAVSRIRESDGKA